MLEDTTKKDLAGLFTSLSKRGRDRRRELKGQRDSEEKKEDKQRIREARIKGFISFSCHGFR